jgi:hypothetical protein
VQDICRATPEKSAGYRKKGRMSVDTVIKILGKGFRVAQAVECLPSSTRPEFKPQYHKKMLDELASLWSLKGDKVVFKKGRKRREGTGEH